MSRESIDLCCEYVCVLVLKLKRVSKEPVVCRYTTSFGTGKLRLLVARMGGKTKISVYASLALVSALTGYNLSVMLGTCDGVLVAC